MSYIVLDILMIFLSLVGIISIIRSIIFKIFSPKEDTSVIIISPVGKNSNNAEFILRSWGERLRWSRGSAQDKIICLDAGLDHNTRKICEAVAKEYGNMEIMTCSELKKELNLT